METVDWGRPLTFIVRGNAYPGVGGGWPPLSIGLLNHGKQGPTAAYLLVMGMALCGHKDMATLRTIWAEYLGRFCLALNWGSFCFQVFL